MEREQNLPCRNRNKEGELTMKRLFALFLLVLFPVSSFAAGNADTYKMNVLKVSLKKSDGTWITIAQPNATIDIASAAPSASVAAMMSDTNIPAGSYVNFKIEAGKTWYVSGSDASTALGCLGGPYYTNTGGTIALVGTLSSAGSTATWTSDPPSGVTPTETLETATNVIGNKGEIAITLSLGAAGSGTASGNVEISGGGDLSTPIVINEDSTVSMSFTFDTQNTIHCVDLGGSNYAMFFTPPQAGTSFSITVDGVTNTITAAQMTMAFPS
jgi:hypothetical protein